MPCHSLKNVLQFGSTFLMFVLELWMYPHKEEIALINEQEKPFEFDWITRIVCAIIWPVPSLWRDPRLICSGMIFPLLGFLRWL